MIRKSGLGSHSLYTQASCSSIHALIRLSRCLDFPLDCNICEDRHTFPLTGKVNVHSKCSMDSFECRTRCLRIYSKMLIEITLGQFE